MSAGTIALTNNSANVTGTGTAFTTDLKASDFIVVIVGGVTYTLGVKATTSATALTLITPYNGPTATGNAWTAVPNATLVGITAQVAADVAKAIRGLNLDKANWQQVFSGTGTITVTLPDGSTYTGPAWSSITTSLNSKADKVSGAVPINQGGTGATTQANARAALGALSVTPTNTATGGTGNRIQHASGSGLFTIDYFNCYWYMQPDDANFWVAQAVSYAGTGGAPAGYGRVIYAIKIADGTVKYVTARTDKNTTVDGNGFIKAASPIYRLISDIGLMPDNFTEGFTKSGTGAFNDEAEGVSAEHIGTGQYLVRGCLGFAKEGWTIEVPQDENGNRLIFVTSKVGADGTISLSTYKRRFDVETAMIVAGEPVDIPEGRWIDLRLDMPTGAEMTT